MRRLDSNMLLFSFVSSFGLHLFHITHTSLPSLLISGISLVLASSPRPHPCSHCNVIPSPMMSCYLFEGSVLFPKRRNGSST
ncbi:hypothetical protein CCHR01_18635 [Colletotrichum chrysophilum]|uniref:Secreted protein n=1 Tax=Colletotrichum chrysophilum TaxID=1836956 RepID=A0AAD8ZZZ5_9PEZI|nr:hypothetical protein K456DRAFT_182231 [Colletotrichum gloeosporioides 23]KAK1838737.1 hypothetical protein CCHR01_18635 [Colletotrichum chrysophilum]